MPISTLLLSVLGSMFRNSQELIGCDQQSTLLSSGLLRLALKRFSMAVFERFLESALE